MITKAAATIAIGCAAIAIAVAASPIDDDTGYLKDLQRQGLAAHGQRTLAGGHWVCDDLEHGDTPANAAEKIRQHNGPGAELFVHITIGWLCPQFAGQDPWHEVVDGILVRSKT